MATPLNVIHTLKAQDFAVSDPLACVAAQHCARRMALALGFAGTASEEIALCVSELGTNLVKHAGSGTLVLRPLVANGRPGIEVESSDAGPGIEDVEKSFADGYSTSGSLGCGLGAVNRLMDEVDIHSLPGWGTHMICRRWIRYDRDPELARLWDAAVFTRPRRFGEENGDAFVIKRSSGDLLAGLIDGLGHGQQAQKAALAAQHYVQSHDAQPLEKIFQGVGRACKGTRGVVMALARFKPPTLLEFASIGNIEVRAWTGGERMSFILKRGFLGALEANVHVQDFCWKPEWVLVLHSDGLRTHWQWSDFPRIERESAREVALKLMRALATDYDDATVLAVRRKAE